MKKLTMTATGIVLAATAVKMILWALASGSPGVTAVVLCSAGAFLAGLFWSIGKMLGSEIYSTIRFPFGA